MYLHVTQPIMSYTQGWRSYRGEVLEDAVKGDAASAVDEGRRVVERQAKVGLEARVRELAGAAYTTIFR